MAGIQLSGLASGLDWQTLVDQLIQAESTPVTKATAQKATNATKITTLGELQGDLTDLQDAIDALGDAGTFSTRSAKIADSSSTWSATAAAGTEMGEYDFNVTQLATKAQRAGASNAGSSISSSNTVSGVTLATMNIATAITAGDFTVNGAKINLSLTDSLADVFQKISDATGGTVTATYDSASDAVSLKSTTQIVIGSASDTSNFLTSMKLYNSSESGGSGNYAIQSRGTLGVPVVSATIADSGLKSAITNVDTNGDGTFSINGVPIGFNTKTDSIQAVLNRINASSAGVVAAYDKSGDKFTLTNKITGNIGLTVSEDAGGFLEALGLNTASTFKSGQNAEFTVNNGATIVSTSNNFTSDVTGISGLSVTATTQGIQSVNVTADNSGTRTKIDNFISKYNAVQDYIEAQTKITPNSDGTVTTALLAGNLEIGGMSSKLRSLVFSAVPGLTGAVKRLADIGIDFKSGSSDLEVKDSAKLDDALNNNPGDVTALFTSSSGGLMSAIDAYVLKTTGSGGTLASQTDSLNKQNAQLDDQIKRLNAQLDAERARLTNEFVQMEQAQSTLQTQLKALENAFGTNSSSSSSSSS
ncbi:MAG: flagellar filament capping protein FliD [Chthoniobacteraceae bacterium]|nr:flagellar filament capping protein FliD [Chthoniobacteraceae bacterium]